MRYKEYEVHRRIQVWLEGIRFGWKESGCVRSNQISLVALRIWCNDSKIRKWVGGCVHSLVRLGCIMERVSQGDDGG
jgi:hypothetical protein